jgi:hypothetical protein
MPAPPPVRPLCGGSCTPWLPTILALDAGWAPAVGRTRTRLFSAVADLLGAVAGESGAGLVVEDVHWADSATLDFLTFMAGPGTRMW